MIFSRLSRALIRESMAAARTLRRATQRGRSTVPALVATRLQEAEHLIAGQLPQDDRAARTIARRLGGWTFHR